MKLSERKQSNNNNKLMKLRKGSCLGSYVYNVVVLGDGNVGKSAILHRFLDDSFPNEYLPTVADVYEKKSKRLEGPGIENEYSLKLFDTAGSMCFPAENRLTIAQGHAFVIVYSVDSQRSFECARRLRQDIADVKGEGRIPCVFVGNKCDIDPSKRQVSFETGLRLAVESSSSFLECSARKNTNVEDIFEGLLNKIERIEDLEYLGKNFSSTDLHKLAKSKKRTTTSWNVFHKIFEMAT